MILTPAQYQVAIAKTLTGDDLAGLSFWCQAVDGAIKKHIRPFIPESTTFTSVILDAPLGNVLLLPNVPVRSITSLYLRWGANGEAAAFTSDYLLTVNDDYYMPIDTQPEAYSRSGRVFRRGIDVWGYEARRPLGRLAATIDPNRGAISATYVAGPTSVPSDLSAVAVLLVSKMLNSKKFGSMATSASLNTASYSLPGAALEAGIFGDPTIRSMLGEYRTVHCGGA